MIRRIIFTCLLFLLTSACAPVISQKTMDTVDKNISFTMLHENPDSFTGKNVILGGEIIATNVKENDTWIEVLQRPLGYRQKPLATDQSAGRFLVHFPGFLDPAIYANGRKLTVAGKVAGKIVQSLSGLNYIYPVITAREHHLWKVNENSKPRFGVGIGAGGGSYGGGVGVGF